MISNFYVPSDGREVVFILTSLHHKFRITKHQRHWLERRSDALRFNLIYICVFALDLRPRGKFWSSVFIRSSCGWMSLCFLFFERMCLCQHTDDEVLNSNLRNYMYICNILLVCMEKPTVRTSVRGMLNANKQLFEEDLNIIILRHKT